MTVYLRRRVTGLDPHQRHMARAAISFVCNKFLSRFKEIEINVKGSDLFKKENILGDACWTDSSIKPREFEIRIDCNLEPQEFLQTLMHELVHCKQFAKGELQHNHKNSLMWNRKRVSRNVEYYDCPWEIEANGREIGLCEEFFKHNEKWKQYAKKGFTDYRLQGSSQMVLPFGR